MVNIKIIPNDTKVPYELNFDIALQSKTLSRLIYEFGVEEPIPIQLSKKHLQCFEFYVCHKFYPPLSKDEIIEWYNSDKKTKPEPNIQESLIMLETHLYLNIRIESGESQLIDQVIFCNRYFYRKGLSYYDFAAYFRRKGVEYPNSEFVYKILVKLAESKDLYQDITEGNLLRCYSYGCSNKSSPKGIDMKSGMGFCEKCYRPKKIKYETLFLIIMAKNCSVCQYFKINYYDKLISQLKKDKIRYKYIEIEDKSNLLEIKSKLNQYYQKLFKYIKFFPTFILIDESNSINIYNTEIENYNDNSVINIKSNNIPTNSELITWLYEF